MVIEFSDYDICLKQFTEPNSTIISQDDQSLNTRFKTNNDIEEYQDKADTERYNKIYDVKVFILVIVHQQKSYSTGGNQIKLTNG